MRKLVMAAIAVLTIGATTGGANAACVGWGWHGPGIYVSPLGLRAACYGPVVAPVVYPGPYVYPGYYAVPVYAAPPTVYVTAQEPTSYYCDDPKGYFPAVPSCPGGWRAVAAKP